MPTLEYLSLKGKIAIVTGASRGIGAGIAFDLAKRGADVSVLFNHLKLLPRDSSVRI